MSAVHPPAETAAMSAGPAVVTRATRASRIAGFVALLLIVGLVAMPWWGNRADLRLAGEFATYLALASLWNLLAGYSGLVSVGQQAYVGLGGYVLFATVIFLGVNPLLAIPAAGIIAAIAAVPVGRLIFRLNGAYFAIGTWVIAEVFRLGFAQVSSLGGGSGISLPVDAVRGIASSKDLREWIIFWISLGLGAGSGRRCLSACCVRGSASR